MTVSITATSIDATAEVDLLVTFNSAYNQFKIVRTRVDNSVVATIYTTRSAVGLSSFAGFDFTAPLSYAGPIGPTFNYTVTADVLDSSGNITSTDTATSTPNNRLTETRGRAWIKNPSQAALNKKFEVNHIDPIKRSTRILSESNVIGRENPVIITDVLGSRRGVLYLNAYTGAPTSSSVDILALLSPGVTLFFQTTPDTGFDDMFFTVTGEVLESPYSDTIVSDRIWTVPFTVVDSSLAVVTSVPGRSWLQVSLGHSSWQN